MGHSGTVHPCATPTAGLRTYLPDTESKSIHPYISTIVPAFYGKNW
jgi:hypothetical protein